MDGTVLPVSVVEQALWRSELHAIEREAEGWRKYAGHLETLVVQLRERAEFAEAEVLRKKTQLQSVEEELGFSEARAASMKAMLQAADDDGSGSANDAEEEENGHANDAEAPLVIEPRLQALTQDNVRRSPQENSGSEDSAYEPFAAYEPYGGRPSRSSSRAAETTDHEDYDDEDVADDADDEEDHEGERRPPVMDGRLPEQQQQQQQPNWQVPLARMPVVSTTRGVPMPPPTFDEAPCEDEADEEEEGGRPPKSPSSSEDEHGFVHEDVDEAEFAAGSSYGVGEGAANTVLNGLGWVREKLRRDSF